MSQFYIETEYKLGYSWIKIDHIADSLLKLQIKIGVHLISAELLQLLTLVNADLFDANFTNTQFEKCP